VDRPREEMDDFNGYSVTWKVAFDSERVDLKRSLPSKISRQKLTERGGGLYP
jgi:hypothetical protein